MLRDDAGRAMRLLLSGLGLAALLYSWSFVWQYFSSPAWYDLWSWADDFQKWVSGNYTFHDLIKPHVQHRIATMRLLLLIDSIYFEMSGHFVAVCNCIALLGLGALLWSIAMGGIARRATWYVPALVWAGFVAGTCQTGNLTLAFQVAFALTCCCAVGAAWLFALACAPELSRRVAVARATGGAAAMLAALFSMGSGILLLPALGGLLWLRKAQAAVWVVFVLGAALALGIDAPVRLSEHAAPMSALMSAYMPTGLALIERRAVYSATFLGSGAAALPAVAPWIGFAGYGALLALGGFPVWRRLRGGAAVTASDGTLLAVAVFAALCGPAASLTPRILFGAEGALVSRYATMSLLFWAACGGLVLRRLNDSRPDAAWPRGAVVTAVAGLLYLVNLPSYAAQAGDLKRAIATEAGLLTNNIGVEGPLPAILFVGISAIRNAVGFLHQARLNMFAPTQGPPADLMAQLMVAPAGSLPTCRGSVDRAVAIDSGAVLLDGWLADPDGLHTAPWIVVRDAAGRIVGAARSLQDRGDLAREAGFKPPSYGFSAGFRDGADGPRRLRLAGMFPDRKVKLCELPFSANVSGVLVEPMAELRELRPAPLLGAPAMEPGFMAGLGGAPQAAPILIPSAAMASAGAGTVDFTMAAGGPTGAALVLPFWTPPGAAGKSVTFVLGDAMRLSAPLGPWWGWGFWRAAVLPAALAREHGGAVRVEVRDAGPGTVTVAVPMWATEQPGWSRLF